MRVKVRAIATTEVIQEWVVDVDEETAHAIVENPETLWDALAEGTAEHVEVTNVDMLNTRNREADSAEIVRGD